MTGDLATGILTSTTFELPGYTVERTLGISWGLLVRSVGLTKGLTGGLRALKAGEVSEFTEVMDHARRTAMERLVGHAQQLGGNAVLGCGSTPPTSATAWLRWSPTARPRWYGRPERTLRPDPSRRPSRWEGFPALASAV